MIEEYELKFGKFQVFNSKPDIDFVSVEQVHGSKIALAKTNERPEADGLYLLFPVSFPMGLVTADCLPIVLEGKKGAALLHAGWKGLKEGILLNSQLKSIQVESAYIGPCISSRFYEVGHEFLEYFPDSIIVRASKLYLDLRKEARSQLQKKYSNITIEESPLCTYSHPELHSYRANSTEKRNYNIYIPNDYTA